jgi:uncharacterized protein YdhG (YjbR/CyaY superfamily)
VKAKPETVDEYLAGLPAGQRAALKKLRAAIRAAVPRAEECIAYGVPTYRLRGAMLVSFGAASRHVAFYPGAAPIAALARELSGYDTSKGTIRFAADEPLPVSLVRKLMKVRVAEHTARARNSARETRATAGRTRRS